jgi:hypothetical protein
MGVFLFIIVIKLSDLIKEFDIQPSEKAKMKNFLYRGSRDQIDIHPNRFNVIGSRPGTIEGKGPLDTSDHPENKNISQIYNNGYPWNVPEAGGIFENEGERIFQALIGREFQTLEDVKKMASRLRQAGFAQSDIEEFIRTYLM